MTNRCAFTECCCLGALWGSARRLGGLLVLSFLLVAIVASCTRHSMSDRQTRKDSAVAPAWVEKAYAAPKLAFSIYQFSVKPFTASVSFEYETREFQGSQFEKHVYEDSVSMPSTSALPYLVAGFEVGSRKGLYAQVLYAASSIRKDRKEIGVGYNAWYFTKKRFGWRPYLGIQWMQARYRFNSFIDNRKQDIRVDGALFEYITYKPGIRDILMGNYLNLSYSERLWPQLYYTSVGVLLMPELRCRLYKDLMASVAIGYYAPLWEAFKFRLRSNGKVHGINTANPLIQYKDNIGGKSPQAIRSNGFMGMWSVSLVF